MAEKNLMTAIAGLSNAKADPKKVQEYASKKPAPPKRVGNGGTIKIKEKGGK